MNTFSGAASLDRLPGSKKNSFSWLAPSIVEGAAGTATAFDTRNASALSDPRVETLVIQNCGTLPVKLCVNSEIGDNQFHLVLAGGSGVDSGDGGNYIFYPRRDRIKYILAKQTGGGAIRLVRQMLLPVDA